MQAGIEFPYTALDPVGASTFCPRCEASLVERDGSRTISVALLAGTCVRCGQVIPGRFSTPSRVVHRPTEKNPPP